MIPTLTPLSSTSPFQAVFGVQAPKATVDNAPSRSYVSMPSATDTFERSAAQQPYFSSQSFRAQYSQFALAALNEQRRREPTFGKQGKTTPARTTTAPTSIVYNFASPTDAPQFAGKALQDVTPMVALRIRAQALHDATEGAKSNHNAATTLNFTTDAVAYRPTGDAIRQHLKFGKQSLPNLIQDAIPVKANYYQLGDGRLVAEHQVANVQQTRTPFQQALFAGTQKLLQALPVASKFVQLTENDLTLATGHRVPLMQTAAQLGDGGTPQTATPLRLVQFGKHVVELITPAFNDAAALMQAATHTRFSSARTHAETLANTLETTTAFGTRLARQPEATAMSPPQFEAASPASPFRQVAFKPT